MAEKIDNFNDFIFSVFDPILAADSGVIILMKDGELSVIRFGPKKEENDA